ncbi:MAG: O-6-alkylguanine-DNA--cysteine-protein methyltransferase [Herpetosiphon sp.]
MFAFNVVICMQSGSLYERIYAVVRHIPRGKIMTYGDIGKEVGCAARVVGYALHHLRKTEAFDVPWQRVINYRGGISTHGNEQRQLLEDEGILFDQHGMIERHQWSWKPDESSTPTSSVRLSSSRVPDGE